MYQGLGEMEDAASRRRQFDHRKTILEFGIGSLGHMRAIQHRCPAIAGIHVTQIGDVVQKAEVVQGGILVVRMDGPFRPQAPMPTPALRVPQRTRLRETIGVRRRDHRMATFMMQVGAHQLTIGLQQGRIPDPFEKDRITADMGIDMTNGAIRLRMGLGQKVSCLAFKRLAKGAGLARGENIFLHHPAMAFEMEELITGQHGVFPNGRRPELRKAGDEPMKVFPFILARTCEIGADQSHGNRTFPMLQILSVVRSRRHYPLASPVMQWCTHQTQVLALHLVGKGKFIVGGEELIMQAPLLAVVAKGERNGNGLTGANDAWWCNFQGQALSLVPGGKAVKLSLGEFSLSLSHVRRLDHADAAHCSTLFQNLQTHALRPGLHEALKASTILCELLSYFVAPLDPRPTRDPVDNYRMLITQRLDSAVSLEDLATQAGGHPDALGAIFRKRYGMTPVAFRLRLRLQVAGKLLLGNRVTIAEAAQAAGFTDPSYFTRVFKRTHGLSPRDWSRR